MAQTLAQIRTAVDNRLAALWPTIQARLCDVAPREAQHNRADGTRSHPKQPCDSNVSLTGGMPRMDNGNVCISQLSFPMRAAALSIPAMPMLRTAVLPIVLGSAQPEMRRIDTERCIAPMQDPQVVRDGAICQEVRQAMCRPSCDVETELPVILDDDSLPEPTRVWRTDSHTSPKHVRCIARAPHADNSHRVMAVL